MNGRATQNDIIQQLQKEILSLQGLRKATGDCRLETGLLSLEAAFPEQTFPTGVVHEFISYTNEEAAATSAFIAGLSGRLMQKTGTCLWIGTKRIVFPPALKGFGIEPERIIFIDLAHHKEALWAVEEALKCKTLSAVIGELPGLSFTESRRLQLAVEHSHVTGFIHRHRPQTENTVACVTRWKISPLASEAEEGMPGLAAPRWSVELIKVRNGRPGSWQIEWRDGSFQPVTQPAYSISAIRTRKTG
jgi:protein ImuA